MNEYIDITWLGHACFMLESDSYKILIDPYKDGYVPGLRLQKQCVHEVICSHEHTDHNFREMATILPALPSPFSVTSLETYHDDKNGNLRGKNKIHMLEAHGIKVVHFGDIGCDITDEQCDMLKNVDAVMLPVGGFYTINAEQAKAIIEKLSPRLVIPMHYKTNSFGFDVLQDISEFTGLCRNAVFSQDNTLRLTAASPCGCIVMKYIPQ